MRWSTNFSGSAPGPAITAAVALRDEIFPTLDHSRRFTSAPCIMAEEKPRERSTIPRLACGLLTSASTLVSAGFSILQDAVAEEWSAPAGLQPPLPVAASAITDMLPELRKRTNSVAAKASRAVLRAIPPSEPANDAFAYHPGLVEVLSLC